MIPLAQNSPSKVKKNFLFWTTRHHESLQGLNSSLAQSAAELWPPKFAQKGQIMPFLKSLKLGKVILATDMLASQSSAL